MNLFWQKEINPNLPVIIVIQSHGNAPNAMFRHCIEALGVRHNILLCACDTAWRNIKLAIKKVKISTQNIKAILFNQRPTRALLRSCQRHKIPTLFIADNDNPHIVIRGIRAANKTIYANKAIFDKISTNFFCGYPLDLTILSHPFNATAASHEIMSSIQQARYIMKQREDEIKFLIKNRPINLKYWSGRHLKFWLSRKDAIKYLREWQTGIHPKRPIAGFHPGIYAEHHDLTLPNGVQADPFIHYLQSGCPQGQWCWPVISAPIPITQTALSCKTALHIHAHYPEMVADMAHRLRANKIRPDLYISVKNKDAALLIKKFFIDYEAKVVIRIVPNKGRDIAPILTEFGTELINNYDFIGHIHTKKSPHISDKSYVKRWRNFLLLNLLGDGKFLTSADTIIQTLYANKDVQLIFPDDKNAVSWVKNHAAAQNIAAKLGLQTLPHFFNFPVGTMFWGSSCFLCRFVDMQIKWDDYPNEPLDFDGTMLHAIERLLGIVASQQSTGIRCVKFGKSRR